MTSAWSIYQSGPLGVPLLDYMIYSWENKWKQYWRTIIGISYFFPILKCIDYVYIIQLQYTVHVYTYND